MNKAVTFSLGMGMAELEFRHPGSQPLALSLYHMLFFHIIRLCEVIDFSSGNLDSSLCFLQPSVSHDVLCIEVK